MYLLALFAPIVSLVILLTSYFQINRKTFVTILFVSLLISFLISLNLVYEVIYLNSFCYLELKTWWKLGNLEVKWSFYFDKLSVALLFLIIWISILVHFFALDYLSEDPHLPRFLVLLTLFTVFMEILVTSGNLIQFFLGWEGVGLMSYLLINFWFTRYSATNSGLMAIIYNRIGDTGLLLAISLICFTLETTDFVCLFLLTKFASLIQIQIFFSYFFLTDLLIIFLFLGVIGKSAQIFLESWLASAMEGPTPVSSLLHASTMIVSGVFLLQRFQPYVFCSLNGMILVTCVGAITAFFAGTIGLVSMDLKRIIAYSTCSQMGYLVFCIGIGNTNVSLFHLLNHAFFKCLLFVAAGTIIHALLNEQDIRKMGGLYKLLPFSFVLIFVASLSLMGFPFLSGYYSKEKILENSLYIYNHYNLFAFWFGNWSAFLTSIYSMRLIFFSFFNYPNSFKNYYSKLHTDLKFYLNWVLWILGLGSIFSGFLLEDLMMGPGNDWLIFTSNHCKIYNLDLHLGNFHLNFLAFYYTCIGIVISFFFFYKKKAFNLWFVWLYQPYQFRLSPSFQRWLNRSKDLSDPSSEVRITSLSKRIYLIFSKRWYINLFYNRYVANSCFWIGYNQTFLLLDKGFLELPTLLSVRYISDISKFLSSNLYRYFFIGEFLLYFFLIYYLYFFLFWIDFCLICEKPNFCKMKDLVETICNPIVNLVKTTFFFYLFAVPKKRKRTKKLKKMSSLLKIRTLVAIYLKRKNVH